MTNRRTLLVAVLSVPVTIGLARVVGLVGSISGAIASSVRPSARGSSATLCAACGASDHTMLDPRCPSHPRLV